MNDAASGSATSVGAVRPPRHCPCCGQDLSEHPYYQRGIGKTARVLRGFAAALIPITAAVYFAQLFWGGASLGFGTGAGYLGVAYILAPSALLYMASRLLPPVRIVICLRCSWNHEYSWRDPLRA